MVTRPLRRRDVSDVGGGSDASLSTRIKTSGLAWIPDFEERTQQPECYRIRRGREFPVLHCSSQARIGGWRPVHSVGRVEMSGTSEQFDTASVAPARLDAWRRQALKYFAENDPAKKTVSAPASKRLRRER
jgi:hypothetical protein